MKRVGPLLIVQSRETPDLPPTIPIVGGDRRLSIEHSVARWCYSPLNVCITAEPSRRKFSIGDPITALRRHS